MKYRLEFTETALDDLSSLGKPVAQQIFKRLHWMEDNFESITHDPLTGNWQGVYKLRIGDYRVLYTFEKGAAIITVHIVRHRRHVYKTK